MHTILVVNWKINLNWLVLDIMVLGLGLTCLTSTWQYNNCSRIYPILYWCNPHYSVKQIGYIHEGINYLVFYVPNLTQIRARMFECYVM